MSKTKAIVIFVWFVGFACVLSSFPLGETQYVTNEKSRGLTPQLICNQETGPRQTRKIRLKSGHKNGENDHEEITLYQ